MIDPLNLWCLVLYLASGRDALGPNAPKVQCVGWHFEAHSQIGYDFRFSNPSGHTVFYGVEGKPVYGVESRADPRAAWEPETGHFGFCGNAVRIKALPGGGRTATFSVLPRREDWKEFRVYIGYTFDRAEDARFGQACSAPIRHP